MSIPSFENIKFVDENGMLTPEWRSILQSLFQILQDRFSDEGLVPPSQTATNIGLLNPNISSLGTMVYDTTDNVIKANIANVWQTLGGGSPLPIPVPIIDGGTGQITQQLAINALAGAVTEGDFLRGDGANVTMSTIEPTDLPVNTPIQLSIDTSINGASLTVGLNYIYQSIAAGIITLTILGGATLRNPPLLNGSPTTVGFNPEDVFTLTRYSDNTILIT